jgi:vacuolar protein sorting-associated protein 13A/C
LFFQGFVDGVTGVVTKPVSGARHGGASGFVKGLGKGFLGLVTRPTGGIVDFASTSLDLIKRSVEMSTLTTHRTHTNGSFVELLNKKK